MNNRFFTISDHALKRMEARNISRTMLAKIVFGGQVYSCGNGCYKAKLWQRSGKNEICYSAVFSKAEKLVVTVWSNIKPCRTDDDFELSQQNRRKIYKQRKRTICQREFDTYCREEFSDHSVRRCA